ncbi:heterokaryon incompatibility protein-domain-containing protein [Xylariales sp. AK1849]|nr:heterokaryon incompatibility protein-domain-containing protein [Xylariales sp. AK1849]
MLTLESLPFSRAACQPPLALEDASFQYQPHIVCAACRELLKLGLELHKERGAKMAEDVWTKYTSHEIRESAKLGCHLCAIFEVLMLDPIQPKQLLDEAWDAAFAVQRSITESALFMITPEWKGRPGHGNAYGYPLRVYPWNCQDYDQPKLLVTDSSELSLGRSTGDEETFSLARCWLDQCLKDHSLCAENDDEARVVRPARLLSLDKTIRLVDSIEADGQDYVSLSHCWGRQTYVPRLLHETEAGFRKGIEFVDLPKTFQDAVAITRKLGYRYIWVDSLCIIQDSVEDWKAQAKIMALVYVNSVFTIAALKSPGSSGGCFTDERNPLGLRPLHHDELGVSILQADVGRLWEMEVNTSGYGASPLHSRAWVVQERLSSPRTLLYGSSGIYWECRCAQASECHYRKVTWDDDRNKKTWLQKLETRSNDLSTNPPSVTDVQSTHENWMNYWIDLLKTYSGCELTMKTDKIIAVTGLISEVERRSRSSQRCILGLWAHDLPRMALWYRSRNDTHFPTDAIGRLNNGMPSWTWASVEGRCSYLTAAGRVEWETIVEIDEASKPAKMTMNTWRRKVLLNEDNEIILDPDDPQSSQKGWGGDPDDTYAWFPDCGMPDIEKPLFVAMVQRARIVESPPIWAARCLLVMSNTEGGDMYGKMMFTRVGLVTIRFSDPRDDVFKFKDQGAREVLVLM